MRIASIETRGFRNLADAELPLGAGVTALHGPNGAGKSNLLEAVYFGLAARSFRTGNDRDMVAHGAAGARVELRLAEGEVVLAALDRAGERRHLLAGRPAASAPASRPLVSVFHPDRLELVKGPPAKRRAHLDRLIAALWPARADLRSRFGRTLAQRNALAARARAGLADAGSLSTWDLRLAREAQPLIEARADAAGALAEPVADLGAALGLQGLEIRYRPRVEADAAAIATELAVRRQRELGRAYLSYGPQLDELELRAEGRPLRRFGSQGQQRTALLALLFAERATLVEAGRPAPLMLLDDVMSELDPERRELLALALLGAGQSLISSTELAHIPAAAEAEPIAVRGGAALAPALAAPRAEAA